VLQYKIYKRERMARDLLLVLLVDLKNIVDLNLNTADLTLNAVDYRSVLECCGSDIVYCARSVLECCADLMN
jgi:hypothetical protein